MEKRNYSNTKTANSLIGSSDYERLEVTKSTKKRIGFFASILIVIGGCVGAGIFFKSKDVLGFSGGNVYFSIFAWIIAAFVVICLALSLVEILSASNDNLSLIGWCKKFNSKYIYKSCKYYTVYIYAPLMYFCISTYIVLVFLDALSGFNINVSSGFNTNIDWLIWTIICVLIASYFIFSSGLSSRVGNIQNMIFQIGKFLPIFVITVVAIIILVQTKTINNTSFDVLKEGEDSIFKMIPFFGLFGSLASIYFAYDGFYHVAGIKSEMKEPKKTPKVLVIGISIVTCLYVTLAVFMSLAVEGGSFNSISSGSNEASFYNWFKNKNVLWIYGIVNLLIMLALCGILNSFSMWASRFIEDLVKNGEIYIPRKFYKHLDPHFPKVGVIYLFTFCIPSLVFLCLIGNFFYFTSSAYKTIYGEEFGKIITFANLIGSWMTLFSFAYISLAVFGGLVNRKTNKVKVEKYKHFVWTGWISFISIMLVLVVNVLQPFIDLVIILTKYNELNDKAIGMLLNCILFFVFAIVSFAFIKPEEININNRRDRIYIILSILDNPDQIFNLLENKNNRKEIYKNLIKKTKYSKKVIRELSCINWNLYQKDKIADFKKQIDIESYLLDQKFINYGIDSFAKK